MTENIVKIPARIKNAAIGGHVAGTEDIVDDVLEKTQAEINSDLYALITDLPISDGTNIESGKAYIDSTDRCVKVKA